MDQYDLLPSFTDANNTSKVALEEKSSNCLQGWLYEKQGSDLSASQLGLHGSVQMF